jgi:ArsR family transcriptional regulator
MKCLGAKERVNLMFRAVADPTRLRILHLLHGGELCVGDLVEILRVPQPTASRHLGYLRRAALVETRKDGKWIHYALAPAGSPFHEKLIECLGCCFGDVPAIAADAKRAGRVRPGGEASGGCCA